MLEQARILLVGAGRMGAIRAPMLFANPRFQLAAIADISEEQGYPLASSLGIEFRSLVDNSIDEILKELSCDACWISTPTSTHVAYIEAASSVEGLGGIFVEKPVANTVEDIRRLYSICFDNNASLCCGFQRRFDDSYIAAKEAVAAGRVGEPSMIRIMFGDHPTPPSQFLLAGGNPFMDLSPHDIDFARWILADEPTEVYATGSSSTEELRAAGIYDNATMLVKFSRGAVVTLNMSRGATYGYDQRAEVFGNAGSVSVGNQFGTSTSIFDTHGVHASKLKHSFPQRFREAFENEVDAFADTILCHKTWPVDMQACIAVQSVAEAANLSALEGRSVSLATLDTPDVDATPVSPAPIGRPVVIRPIGAGTFGRYIRTIVGGTGGSSVPTASFALKHRCEMKDAFTRSSGLDWEEDVLRDGCDAVYVCSPDSEHDTQANEVLNAGKHVLVEKPVHNWNGVIAKQKEASREKHLVLMVGFQRRFDAEFLRCRDFIRRCTSVKEIFIESCDPVEPNTDMGFVFRNSVCHDIDLLGFLYDFRMSAEDMHFQKGTIDRNNSSIQLLGEFNTGEEKEVLTLRERAYLYHRSLRKDASVGAKRDAESGSGAVSLIQVKINYCKGHDSYVQRVTVITNNDEKHVFGYDFSGWSETFCELYAAAYAAQWSRFLSLIEGGENLEESQHRLESYSKTFARVEQAAQVLGL
eukprot:GSChrysophyteH1.ASY1.ANO1.1196.1 assembled CDS